MNCPSSSMHALLLCPTPPPGLRLWLLLLLCSPCALQPVNILHCHHQSALRCWYPPFIKWVEKQFPLACVLREGAPSLGSPLGQRAGSRKINSPTPFRLPRHPGSWPLNSLEFYPPYTTPSLLMQWDPSQRTPCHPEAR